VSLVSNITPTSPNGVNKSRLGIPAGSYGLDTHLLSCLMSKETAAGYRFVRRPAKDNGEALLSDERALCSRGQKIAIATRNTRAASHVVASSEG
jgi:hypothetical protein